MKELATLPASIRERLEQARSLAQQGQSHEAQTIVRDATTELARSNPELAALIFAAQAGYRGILWETLEEHTVMERVEYRFFGIPIKTAWIPITDRKRTTRTLSLF